MNVTVTNLGTVPLPYSSTNAAGFVIALQPGESTTTNNADVTVTVAGDRPSIAEDFAEFAKNLLDLLTSILRPWREAHAATLGPPTVKVRIVNNGTNALRVILGDNTNDTQVDAGATYEAEAPDFVEIRELGV